MNAAFREVIAAGDDDRRNLFLATSGRLGTAVQNVEKDFWVCWTLDALFNGLAEDSPRLLFQGGTSLSKSFGLIERFSEDVDITVFRNDLGEAASVEELEALSGRKRRARLEAIKEACQAFIAGPLLRGLTELAVDVMTAARVPADRYRVEVDAADADRQTLLFWYPSATTVADEYIRSAVKIEGGAKSALDPHLATSVRPYADDDLPATDLAVGGITTVEAQRTFWDKVVILHGLRRWYDHRGQLRHGGQRVSRHYYDVFRLLQSPTGDAAEADRQLGEDCARHARMFFNTPDFDLDQAAPGTLSLAPSAPMLDALERDYDAMAGMIIGAVPAFAEVMAVISALEQRLNGAADCELKTVNNVLAVLNKLLKTAVEWNVIERMPCTIRLLPIPKPSASFHDFDEYERLVEAAADDRQAHLVVLLGGEAGLRCGEMMALEWTDVDLVKRQLRIAKSDWKGYVTTPKGGRLRYVPLTERLAAALRTRRHLKGPRVLCSPGGSPLTQREVQGLVARAARRANLVNVGVHILRHTFCSHLAMHGAPARAIQELAGHQDLTTTQRYMHLSPAAIESAIRLLDRGNSVATAHTASANSNN